MFLTKQRAIPQVWFDSCDLFFWSCCHWLHIDLYYCTRRTTAGRFKFSTTHQGSRGEEEQMPQRLASLVCCFSSKVQIGSRQWLKVQSSQDCEVTNNTEKGSLIWAGILNISNDYPTNTLGVCASDYKKKLGRLTTLRPLWGNNSHSEW